MGRGGQNRTQQPAVASERAPRPLLILSAPDHFHGAHLWRVGLEMGVPLLLPDRASQPIYTASRFTMRLRTDVRVQYADGVATLSSPTDIFLPPETATPTPTRRRTDCAAPQADCASVAYPQVHAAAP